MIGRTKGPDFKDPEPTHVLAQAKFCSSVPNISE